MQELLTLRAYARRRKERGLSGGSHTAVRKAIADGRLSACIVFQNGKPKIDPAIADREWVQETDPQKARAPDESAGPAQGALFAGLEEPRVEGDVRGDPTTVRQIRAAQAVRLTYQAKLAQLEYRQKAGELVPRARVELEEFRRARAVRDAVRGIPDRIAAVVAAESDVHRVRLVLQGAIDTALRELSTAILEDAGDAGAA